MVGASPTLPSLLGRPVTEACAEMTNLGYRCDARPDVLHRNANVVAAQEPAPGTPLDPGDTVVVHYAPFDPLPVKLFRAKNDDPVWVMRIGDLEPGLRDTYDHANPQVLGYAYPIDRAQPGASRVVNGFFCVRPGTTVCGGFERNHLCTVAEDLSNQARPGELGQGRHRALHG
ncbi:MAG TPA: PASTA domain-containing protein [Micromonosporaceae bacterium]|nr:PASTA domain-containing protein [Micromonosporaceae bacterium]